MKKIKSGKGFTLIEILIVISIISILFLLFIPQVDSFFNKSKESGIRTDFRSFQLSNESYFRENSGLDIQLDNINKFMDTSHKLNENGAIKQTMSRDPWGNHYEATFDMNKIGFHSYGQNGNPSIKKYSIVTYIYNNVIDSCTTGFETGNIELTKIKNLPPNFECGDDVSIAIVPPSESLNTPGSLSATNITETTAELLWSSVVNATEYILKKDGVIIYTGGNRSYSDISLTPNNTYEYAVAARNSTQTSTYRLLSVTTKSTPQIPLVAPRNFRASNVTETTINLAWDNVANATEYVLKRDGITIYTGSNAMFLDTGLKSGTNYAYTVSAKNETQISSNSQLNTKTSDNVPIASFKPVKMISAGNVYTLVTKDDGTVWGWGYNVYGTLLDGTTAGKNHPVQANLTDVKTVSAGYNHTVILKNDGTVWTVGLNNFGQLGDGTKTNRTTPRQIMTDVKMISASDYRTVVLKNDGTIWAWGRNQYGQLGDGTKTDSVIPLPVKDSSGNGNLVNVKSISAGTYHTIAIKNDGTVWSWGYNYYGQLGDETKIQSDLPVKTNITDVEVVLAGINHTVALKNDGTVWTWGHNLYGQLGDGKTTSRIQPLQVIADIKMISTYRDHTIALKNDGTVWTWGYNWKGQIGNGTTLSYNVPYKVKDSSGNDLKDVNIVSAGYSHTVVSRSDGSVWAWGSNEFGELGNGTNISSSVPVKLND